MADPDTTVGPFPLDDDFQTTRAGSPAINLPRFFLVTGILLVTWIRLNYLAIL